MKHLNIKHAVISSIVVYLLGIVAFIGSYYLPIMDNLELQANLVLMVVILPAAYVGALLYYRKGHSTNGLIVGTAMFIGAIILDATITVPLFIMPYGGDHLSFFGNIWFWLIGMEYVSAVAIYWHFKVPKPIAQ